MEFEVAEILEGIRSSGSLHLVRGSTLSVVESLLSKGVGRSPVLVTSDEDIRIGREVWRKGTTFHRCSACDTFISRSNYCPHCGQKVVWCTSSSDSDDKNPEDSHKLSSERESLSDPKDNSR